VIAAKTAGSWLLMTVIGLFSTLPLTIGFGDITRETDFEHHGQS
jgi:hypothetical protein